MNIVCIGGGPAGLYFALLMKLQNATHNITVVERNKPYDTFGWGVVFSDATMDNLWRADTHTAASIQHAFCHWDDIELHCKGRTQRSGGHGFVGIGRKKLLNILQARCEDTGVNLVFECDATDTDFPEADLIVACDGIFSKLRDKYAATFLPSVITRPNRYLWLGTHKRFDAFNFLFEKTEHGWFQAHVYKFDETTTTFIVECPEAVWLAHGLEQASTEQSVAFCEKLFAAHLGGEALLANFKHPRGSTWLNFQQIKCQQWSLSNGRSQVVLMGDAVHTAHFSIGSGTKMAIEDAIELTRQFGAMGDHVADIPKVLARYQALRCIEVERLQNAAWNAMEWFEVVGQRYADQMQTEQLMYSMLTRSQRIGHENLRRRDATWLEGYERWLARHEGVSPSAGPAPLPMLLPLELRSLQLKNRIVVAPVATYCAVAGVMQDFHLVHLGARALGGAALVMVEMTSPSADGRITPACTGLWNDAQQTAAQRIVAFVHANSSAKIGLQLGHAGPKGSTQVGWEQPDEPLPEGNWPLLAASAVPWGPQNQTPRAMTRTDMDTVCQDFVAATRRAAEAGFDWLELHAAHGYLLSSFICPLTNRRSDEYGGNLHNRCRFPLEVFAAMRAVWPAQLPMSVRISAHDWVPGGSTPEDAVLVARLFKAAGCDMIDVSAGQTTRAAQPLHGRMYQASFADRIRFEAGIRTMTVGVISEADHANSIVAAGRADLCAVARPHLADPAWTLHETARLGHHSTDWPLAYLSGRDQLYHQISKSKSHAARKHTA